MHFRFNFAQNTQNNQIQRDRRQTLRKIRDFAPASAAYTPYLFNKCFARC